MSAEVTNIHEAKTHLSRLLERVAEGEEIIIGKSGKPVAKLVPYSAPKPVRKPGSLKGKIWIGPDFDTVDHEIEKLFHEGPIEPPVRHTHPAVVARSERKAVKQSPRSDRRKRAGLR